MKTIIVFVIATAVLLLVKSSIVFANTTSCKLVESCTEKDKCSSNKKPATAIEELDVDPFTILITGNHF